MISFKSRCETIRNADRITRYVNSVYPHVSESGAKEQISRQILKAHFGSPKMRQLSNLELKYTEKINDLYLKYGTGIQLLHDIIHSLKDVKIGNCFESARLAEIIGKINGQENIYPMKILVSRNSSGYLMPLNHVVAVVTKKEINPNQEYEFKNKEAVILDPWLGVSEFASSYLKKIKNDFARLFYNMPDSDFSIRYFAKTSKNIKEFHQKRKEQGFNPEVRFLLHEEGVVTKEEAENLRYEFPELIIKDYKKIQ